MITLMRRATAHRRRARRLARAALSAPDYTLQSLRLGKALTQRSWTGSRDPDQSTAAALPLTQFAQRVLDRRDAKVRRRGAALDVNETAQRHRLRIAIKKLRYACEFLAPLFGKKRARAYIARVIALQEILGGLNDDATCARLLDSLARPDDPADVGLAIAYLREYAAARSIAGISALEQAWSEFSSAKRFW